MRYAMRYRILLLAAVLASGLAGAETIAVDNGIAVKQTDVATPTRGMTMDEVASKFGDPASKVPAVGNPPISRWEYPGFIVYFEHEHVIHSVVANSTGDTHSPSGDTAPSADVPPASSADAPAASAAAPSSN